MIEASFRTPLNLRGHHMVYLTALMPPIGRTPEDLARSSREAFVRQRGDLTADSVDWQLISQHDHPGHGSVYHYDLVGETTAQADAYESALRSALTDFVTLPKDARIRLTGSDELDAICKACTFKRHCVLPNENGVDAQYLDLFEDILAVMRKKDKTLFESVARLSTGDLLTSASAMRRVMTLFALGGAATKDLYYDALARQRKYGSLFASPDYTTIEAYLDKVFPPDKPTSQGRQAS